MHLEIVSENSFSRLKLKISNCKFPEKILERNTSLFWVLAVSKVMK